MFSLAGVFQVSATVVTAEGLIRDAGKVEIFWQNDFFFPREIKTIDWKSISDEVYFLHFHVNGIRVSTLSSKVQTAIKKVRKQNLFPLISGILLQTLSVFCLLKEREGIKYAKLFIRVISLHTHMICISLL